MTTPQWINSLFTSVNTKDVNAFMKYLTDDAIFQFANADPVIGKDAIQSTVQAFFDSIKTIHHHLIATWTQTDTVICQGEVTYTRNDGSQCTFPFANIFKMEKEHIKEYLIYVDASTLYSQ